MPFFVRWGMIHAGRIGRDMNSRQLYLRDTSRSTKLVDKCHVVQRCPRSLNIKKRTQGNKSLRNRGFQKSKKIRDVSRPTKDTEICFTVHWEVVHIPRTRTWTPEARRGRVEKSYKQIIKSRSPQERRRHNPREVVRNVNKCEVSHVLGENTNQRRRISHKHGVTTKRVFRNKKQSLELESQSTAVHERTGRWALLTEVAAVLAGPSLPPGWRAWTQTSAVWVVAPTASASQWVLSSSSPARQQESCMSVEQSVTSRIKTRIVYVRYTTKNSLSDDQIQVRSVRWPLLNLTLD